MVIMEEVILETQINNIIYLLNQIELVKQEYENIIFQDYVGYKEPYYNHRIVQFVKDSNGMYVTNLDLDPIDGSFSVYDPLKSVPKSIDAQLQDLYNEYLNLKNIQLKGILNTISNESSEQVNLAIQNFEPSDVDDSVIDIDDIQFLTLNESYSDENIRNTLKNTIYKDVKKPNKILALIIGVGIIYLLTKK
jgi:hypothetical protein